MRYGESLVSMLVMGLFLGCTAGPPCDAGELPEGITIDSLRALGQYNLVLINAERAFFSEESDDAQPLEWNEELFNVSLCHAKDMCDRQFFAHVNPDGDAPVDRAGWGLDKELGRDFFTYGENIAYSFNSAISNLSDVDVHQKVVRTQNRGYMDECQCSAGCPSGKQAGHRTNILQPDFTEVGIGYWYCSADNAFYNVQNFWRRNPDHAKNNPYCAPGFTADPPEPSTALELAESQ